MTETCGMIDNNLAGLIHTIIVIIKIGVPVLLIIFGMIDFGKGVIAKNEDEIKSSRKIFTKRLISAILVFFVITIIQLIVNTMEEKKEIWQCANLILNGKN